MTTVRRSGGPTAPDGVGRIVGDDEERVRRTLAGYCQLLDDGEFDRWIELFTDDARLVFADQVSVGRTTIRTFMERIQPPEGRGKHITANILVDVDGDTATAHTDYLFVRPTDQGPVPVAIGRYDDELVRDGDRWQFRQRAISLLGPPRANTGD